MKYPSLFPVTFLLLTACGEADRSLTSPLREPAPSFSTSSLSTSVLAGPIVNPANGHWYYLLSRDNWTNSEAFAISLGGHLVTINDQAENDWVFNEFSSYGGISRSLWIGFTDQQVEGTFVWASGENPGYTNWSPGQPNNGVSASRGPESFAHFWSPDFIAAYGFPVGTWNDYVDLDSVDGTSVNGVVEVRPGQTISFGPLSNRTFGDPPFAVSASASSGLAVTFSANGNCTVAGGTVALTAAGACTITAEQAGNAAFNPAPSVSQSFAIARPVPTKAHECKQDGWQFLARADGSSFKNQGACIQYVNTGK